MPKSKTHQKRKLKKRKRQGKFDSLIDKRLAAFKALPEKDQLALLTRWKKRSHDENEGDVLPRSTDEAGSEADPEESQAD